MPLLQSGREPFSQTDQDDFMSAIMRALPFKKLANFSAGTLTLETLRQLLGLVNSDMDPEQILAALRGG